jgi:hypothetical protein
MRLALKLATGAGKTTVMAMLIAWQTINAVRRPDSKRFSRGFLVVTPGLTIKDRLRVLQPNDPDAYYADRELVPGDMLDDVNRAKIVITNFHAFKLRERIELSAGGRSLLQGRGEELQTQETEGQMLQRVMPDLMGMKNILVLNDEAHHCYREKPGDRDPPPAMTTALSHPDSPAFLTALKDRIARARISAARSVNSEMVLLYWDIGRGLAEKQQTAGWGDAVVERLAADLRAAFPDIRGFSLQNVWRMKQLYLAHTSPEFLSQLVREIDLSPGETPSADILSQRVRDMVAAVPWGHPRPVSDPPRQLPHIAPDPQAGRQTAWSRGHRCGRQHRGQGRHRLGL